MTCPLHYYEAILRSSQGLVKTLTASLAVPYTAFMSLRKKYWLLAGGLLTLSSCSLLVGQPSYLLFNTWLHDRPDLGPVPAGHTDDASRLNQTRVAEVWKVP